MKAHDARCRLEMQAADALKAALGEVSAIKIREMRIEPPRVGCNSCLMVYVDLFGRRHTLTCEIHADGEPHQLLSTLEGLRSAARPRDEEVMPIIFAPYLSPEAQALCKENKAGFVDLEGNARLSLGEVFIVKRTLPHRSHHRSTTAVPRYPATQEKVVARPAAIHHNVGQQLLA